MNSVSIAAIALIVFLLIIASRLWQVYKRDLSGFWRSLNALQLEIVEGKVVSRVDADLVADVTTIADLQNHYERYVKQYDEDDREFPWFQLIAAAVAMVLYCAVYLFKG